MIQILRETNPAKIWLREKFQISLRLVNGRLIVIRFDLASCGTTDGLIWDADKVWKHCGDSILADDPLITEKHLSIASTIADVLNEKMEVEAAEILGQIKMSFLILDALETQDYGTACLLINQLIERLKPYDPRAYEMWRRWIGNVFHIVRTAISPENGSDTTI